MGGITLSHLGKAFKSYRNRWQRLLDWVLPFGTGRYQQHWVLQHIDLQINPGEAVALVGMNGAGKSTLLKLICGTLQPTTGQIHISGQLAALLELGIGFHPDFTGRQNVFMAGQLLGLHAADIECLMPEIEAFAEIGDYMDQPVRVYSSGMQVRLAFSVATAKRPDILVIDEALSVGDAHFQHKSFERIQQYRALGTTLLIVSHDKNAIQTICDRVVILDHGRLVDQGPPDAMFDLYNAMIASADEQTRTTALADDGRLQVVSGSGEATVTDIRLIDLAQQTPVQIIEAGAPVRLAISVRTYADIPCLVLGFSIRNRLGQIMYGTNTFHTNQKLMNTIAGTLKQFDIDFVMNLGPGTYSVSTALVGSDTHLDTNYEWRDRALTFEVVNGPGIHFEGQVYLAPMIGIR